MQRTTHRYPGKLLVVILVGLIVVMGVLIALRMRQKRAASATHTASTITRSTTNIAVWLRCGTQREPASDRINCSHSDALHLGYSTTPQLNQLYIVAIDSQKRLVWYEPPAPDEKSVAILPGGDQVWLRRRVKLADVHQSKETVTVWGLFSAKPIAGYMLRADNFLKPTLAADLARLTKGAVQVRQVRLEIDAD